MEYAYLSRQEIVKENSALFAYEVLYINNETRDLKTGRYESATVIHDILNRFGRSRVVGHKNAFVHIDEKLLMSDLVFSIPNDIFILSMYDDISLNERVVERIDKLQKQRYKLAVTDIVLDKNSFEKFSLIASYLSYIKIDFSKELDLELKGHIAYFQLHNVDIIAANIDTREKFFLAKEYGCDYFQGDYFEVPEILTTPKIVVKRKDVLHLYQLLIQETSLDEMTSEFENNPAISIQLLQYINSGTFIFSQRIASLHHVILLLGRIKLADWLMFMIYSKSVGSNDPYNETLEMIQNRALLMEKVVQSIRPESRSNTLGKAYFIGLLSLSDEVLGITFSELLKSLHIDNEVRDAILEKKGLLGEVLRVVQNIETMDRDVITEFEKKYDLEIGTIENLKSA